MDQLCFFLRMAAPQDKDDGLRQDIGGLNDGIGELLPAEGGVAVGGPTVDG